MTQQATPQRELTVEEYFSLEEESSVRHEFVDGMLYAMTGAGRRHNVIKSNIEGRLWNAALNTGCQVVSSDMRLQVTETRYYYPDVIVICDPDDRDERFTRKPCVVVEVLSPSTADIDQREKAQAYRIIDGLETYLIVHTDERRVQRHWRDASQRRWQDEVVGDGVIPIHCLKTQLTLADIYRSIEFGE